MKTGLRIMIVFIMTIGGLAFTSCNTTKGMPQMNTEEGHDATMGGGTGTGTIGDEPTLPADDRP